MFSTDRNLLREDSAVAARIEAYATEFGAIDVIVLSRRNEKNGEARTLTLGGGSVQVYPTRSWHALCWGFDALWLAMRCQKPDVITSQDPFETGLIAWIVSLLRSAPLHMQIHTDMTSPSFRRRSFVNRTRLVIAAFVLRRACRIRVVLESIAEKLIKRGITAPITVLPIYVDTAKYEHIERLKHPRFKISLLAVGRLEKEKHIDRCIVALKAARDAGHDAGLTIVGSGREAAALRALMSRYHLDRYVEFAGWQDDVSPYLAQADLVLVPSEYEGYGMVIVEALAAGVPVLATDVGVAREAGAIVVAPQDFSTALMRWIKSGPRQATLMNQPYQDFNEFVARVTADIAECAQERI